MHSYDDLFQTISQLVMCHSPSGMEYEINQLLLEKFSTLGIKAWKDNADNVIAKIAGKTSNCSIAITAHKDEIGGIVKFVGDEGRVEVRRLGGSYPWVYGEGVVDLIGDNHTISGILSFGSRHVSHESPQKVYQEDAALRWENAWIETKCSLSELEDAGIRPGTRMVVGKHRKHPIRLKNHIASYTLDNKASLAILLALAAELKEPEVDVYLLASAKEEVGAIGAMYFTQKQHIDALIALEICPLSEE
ncbi:MAG: M42 family peptidase, partial [Cyanobacteria bacterium P01_A01_bin.45]